MKQLVQQPGSGRVELLEVPPPLLRPGGVLVQTAYSVISSGTERQRYLLARKSLLGKAWARPDLVRQVLQRARRDGAKSTYRKVRFRLSSPLAVGYSSSGQIVAVADDVTAVRPGDYVACAGAGYANHAEVVFVPKNLCVKVPEGLPPELAAFGTLGAIATNAFRQSNVSVGETIAIVGLGLIGLLATFVAINAGCKVIGVDPVATRRSMGARLGASALASDDDEAIQVTKELTSGKGADAVLICASTQSSGPLTLAAEITRDRAYVVMAGVVGFTIPREPYYRKDLTIKLVRSYGPGRYDASYEDAGQDYPIGYVRWTAQRNIAAFLEMATRNPAPLDALISHRFSIGRGSEAYDLLRTDPGALGIVLDYPARPAPNGSSSVRVSARAPTGRATIRVGLIGAGNFAQGTLLPLLAERAEISVRAIASASGLTAKAVADRYHCQYASSDYRELLADPEIDAVVIATKHDSHGPITIDAMGANKDIFVEKPMAISSEELDRVLRAASQTHSRVMVGFNRRYSPMLRAVRELVKGSSGALSMHYRINAGPLAPDHWLHHERYGGRILGEACHFVDSLQFIAGSPIKRVVAEGVDSEPDTVVVLLEFDSGAVGSIMYIADGHEAVPKERIEVFGHERAAIVEDFTRCVLYTPSGKRQMSSASHGKGHKEEIDAFISVLKGRQPDSFQDSVAATRATLAIVDSMRSRQPVTL
jgi:polar amino acid transport system substrate-binding protein